MRILVTGGLGQLGNELRRCLETGTAEIGSIPACYDGAVVEYIDHTELDISDAGAVMEWFDAHEYDLVINCAAITNVDGCETGEDSAYRVNAEGSRNMAAGAARQGAKFVQVSTDYVFSGNEPGDRMEDDAVGPISAYGRTKLAGEILAAEANPRTFVCRTAWLYGYVGRNFVKTMKHLGQTRERVTVVDDQVGNPTSANDLAHEILRIAATEDYGVYHTTNKGTCSWAQFASAIMAGFGLNCEVVPVTSEEYKAANPASADRPHFSSLRNSHLEQTIGDEFRPWRDALATYIENYDELAD
jgi:dTDP-4-dehydrorhamnose reductase